MPEESSVIVWEPGAEVGGAGQGCVLGFREADRARCAHATECDQTAKSQILPEMEVAAAN